MRVRLEDSDIVHTFYFLPDAYDTVKASGVKIYVEKLFSYGNELKEGPGFEEVTESAHSYYPSRPTQKTHY